MIITCPDCHTRFNLQDDTARKVSAKVRCSRCGNVFSVARPTVSEPSRRPVPGSGYSPAPTYGGVTPGAGSPTVGRMPHTRMAERPGPKTNHSRCVVMAVTNQKGGVAKTSTCLNLGTALALQNKRVLLVDFDIQANLTSALGDQPAGSFFDIVEKGTQAIGAVLAKTPYENVWLLPSNPQLALVGRKGSKIAQPMHVLRDVLSSIRGDFDFILIDTPPSIEFFTLNALMAADFIIIPSQCETFSIHGVDQIEKAIDVIRDKQVVDIEYRVLITMYDPEKTVARVIHEKIKKRYRDRSFETVIEMDEKLSESQVVRKPVIFYDRQSASARQYIDLAKEVLQYPATSAGQMAPMGRLAAVH